MSRRFKVDPSAYPREILRKIHELDTTISDYDTKIKAYDLEYSRSAEQTRAAVDKSNKQIKLHKDLQAIINAARHDSAVETSKTEEQLCDLEGNLAALSSVLECVTQNPKLADQIQVQLYTISDTYKQLTLQAIKLLNDGYAALNDKIDKSNSAIRKQIKEHREERNRLRNRLYHAKAHRRQLINKREALKSRLKNAGAGYDHLQDAQTDLIDPAV